MDVSDNSMGFGLVELPACVRGGPRKYDQGTYFSLSGPRGHGNRFFLTLNIHPKDVRTLKLEARQMCNLYFAQQYAEREGSTQDTQLCDSEDKHEESRKVLIFTQNPGPPQCRRSSQVKITASGWGRWQASFSKKALVETLFLEGLKSLLIPDVEIDTTTAGDTKVLVIHPPGAMDSQHTLNDSCPIDTDSETDSLSDGGQQTPDVPGNESDEPADETELND
jgi:hypothetical protein